MKIAKNTYVLLCDDIRMEADNKISLMGVYQDDLIIDEIPQILPSLAFMIVFEGPKIQFTNVELIIKAPKSKPDIVIFESQPEGYVQNDDIKMLFKLTPFRIKAEGKVKLQIRLPESKKAKTIHTFNIINREALD